MSIHLITTAVTPTVHRRCGRLVLAGTTEGEPVRVDPQPLTEAGHLAAILAGRRVYALTRTGLLHLDQDRTKRKTGDPKLTEHKCGQPMPPQFHATTRQPETAKEPEGIPF